MKITNEHVETIAVIATLANDRLIAFFIWSEFV
jgi:hypothetical protein